MTTWHNLLPSDIRALRSIRSRPIPTGSRTLGQRQRTMLLRDGWIVAAVIPMGGFHTAGYAVTDKAITFLDSVKLEDTFR